jgi:hypothetical protein
MTFITINPISIFNRCMGPFLGDHFWVCSSIFAFFHIFRGGPSRLWRVFFGLRCVMVFLHIFIFH